MLQRMIGVLLLACSLVAGAALAEDGYPQPYQGDLVGTWVFTGGAEEHGDGFRLNADGTGVNLEIVDYDQSPLQYQEAGVRFTWEAVYEADRTLLVETCADGSTFSYEIETYGDTRIHIPNDWSGGFYLPLTEETRAEGREILLPEADIALTLPESFTVVPDDNTLTWLLAVDGDSGTELVIQHGPDSKKNEEILLRKLRDPSNGFNILSEDMPIGQNRWFIYGGRAGGWNFMLVTGEGYGIKGHYYPRTDTDEFPAELEAILASVRILSSQGETVTAAGATFTMPAGFTAQALSPQSNFLYKAQNADGAVFGVLAPYDAARQEAWLTRLREGSGYLFMEDVQLGGQTYLAYHSATATSWNFWLKTPEGYGAWFAWNNGQWQEDIPQTAADILSTVQLAGE